MKQVALVGDSGATQLLPARHFPAFSACGRVGGGFSVEGSHSNARYNRHIRNLTPKATPASNSPSGPCSMDYDRRADTPYLDNQKTSNPTPDNDLVAADHRSLSTPQPDSLILTPEALNAAAQAGLAAAAQAERMASAAAADLANMLNTGSACGVEGRGIQSYKVSTPSNDSRYYSKTVQDRDQQALLPTEQSMPPVTETAAAAAGFMGGSSAVQDNLSKQQQQQQAPVMASVQGYLAQQQQQQQQQQQVGPLMPTTFYKGLSTAHGTWQHDGTDFTSGHLVQVLPESWKRRPGTAPARPASSASSRPSSPSAAAAPRRRSISRSRAPAKQHQEQQLQQQHTHVQGPPTPEIQHMDRSRLTDTSHDSWYCYTPVDVLKIEREQQRASEQQRLSEFHPTPGAKYPQRSALVSRYMTQRPHLVEDDACCVSNTSSEYWVDARESGSECPAFTGVAELDYDCVYLAHGKTTKAAVDAVDAVKQPAWWEADEKVARLVKLMLQPSFAVSMLVTDSRSVSHNSSADPNSSTAYSSSNNTAYSDVSQDRGSHSQTLKVYDGLIAANAVRAADIGEQMALFESSKGKMKTKRHSSSNAPQSLSNTTSAACNSCSQMTATGFVPGMLQTPEERHAIWVAELAQRSVRQRQQQILLEAAGVAVCC